MQRALRSLLSCAQHFEGIKFSTSGRPAGAWYIVAIVAILHDARDISIQEPPGWCVRDHAVITTTIQIVVHLELDKEGFRRT
jgi:hypothetical protein